jgi:hypothetical protein
MRIALFHTTLPNPGRKLGAIVVATRMLANTLGTTKAKENDVAILVTNLRLIVTRHLVSLRKLVHNIAASVFADSSLAIGMPLAQKRGRAELA